jgi:hypothetical protein
MDSNQELEHLPKVISKLELESGGERAAVQTLRAVLEWMESAKRLDCGGFSTAFQRGATVGNAARRF